MVDADVVVSAAWSCPAARPPARPSAPSRREPTCTPSRPSRASSADDHQALLVRVASDASQSYRARSPPGVRQRRRHPLPGRADHRPRQAVAGCRPPGPERLQLDRDVLVLRVPERSAMIRARASLPLLLLGITTLAAAACATERKPTHRVRPSAAGVDRARQRRRGRRGSLMLWPMFDLPIDPPQQIFRPRLGGQDAVVVTSQEGFYDYSSCSFRVGRRAGTAGSRGSLPAPTSWSWWMPPARAGASRRRWRLSAGPIIYTAALQIPAVIFAHFDGKVASWNVDPALQDSDTATDEITVTNMADEDVVVERCMVVSGNRPPARPSAPSRREPTCTPSRRWRARRRRPPGPPRPPRQRRQPVL